MNITKYNCPNCNAPIGYNEVCPYCGTTLQWFPTVNMTFKIEKRNIKKCVATFREPRGGGLSEGFVDDVLKEQIGKAASEVWKKEKLPDYMVPNDFFKYPDGATVHRATVYFALPEENKK